MARIMGKKRPGSPPPAVPARPFHDPFARLRERLPAGREPPAAEGPDAPGAPATPPARAVVRIERKGRGGKEATIVEKLELPPAALARWLADARRALGCGGALEGGALVLQGDQRERVARWLEERGVARVTVAR
jgi:translation initiation factor 1